MDNPINSNTDHHPITTSLTERIQECFHSNYVDKYVTAVKLALEKWLEDKKELE